MESYKSINEEQIDIRDMIEKENHLSNEIILEDLLDFEINIYYNLIKAFSTCFDSGNFIKCQIILVKEIIPFFQSRKEIFLHEKLDICFFISAFQSNQTFSKFSIIIEKRNEMLLKYAIQLLSLISSLNNLFCKYAATSPNLLNSLMSHMFEYTDKLMFENCVILLNNCIQYYKGNVTNEFLNQLFESIQFFQLDINITMNIFIVLIRFFQIPISNYPFVVDLILKGISESYFVDSMKLIYYSYQIEFNRFFIIPHLSQILNCLEGCSVSFCNEELLTLYFKILSDVFNFDVDELKSVIVSNFRFEVLKNSQKLNDSKLTSILFSFLAIMPSEFILNYSKLCFNDETDCILFIVNCIREGSLILKKSGMKFLSAFLKATKPEFLNFLIDNNFIDILSDFILSDDSENQKLALQFLNGMIELNFYFQGYSKPFFEEFAKDEIMCVIDELTTSVHDDLSIVELAENLLKYIKYTMDESAENFE